MAPFCRFSLPLVSPSHQNAYNRDALLSEFGFVLSALHISCPSLNAYNRDALLWEFGFVLTALRLSRPGLTPDAFNRDALLPGAASLRKRDPMAAIVRAGM